MTPEHIASREYAARRKEAIYEGFSIEETKDEAGLVYRAALARERAILASRVDHDLD